MSSMAIMILLGAVGLVVLFVRELQRNGLKVASDPTSEHNIVQQVENELSQEFGRIMRRVDTAFESNRIHDAQMALENALKIDPSNEEALGKYAYTLQVQEDFEAAKGIYTKALALHDNSASLHGAYASLLSQMNLEEDAKKHFMRAIDLDDGNAVTYYNFANYLAKLGEIDAAKEGYRQALERDSSLKEAQEALSSLSMKKLS